MFQPKSAFVLTLFIALAVPSFGQSGSNHYALFLGAPPAAARFATRSALDSDAARNYRQQIEFEQQSLRSELAARNFQVTGSVSTVLNAVFITAPGSRVSELDRLPGVIAVVPMRNVRLNMNRATQLMNAPVAWTALGGPQNGGAGLKIAILDSGIDQNHPAFQDSSLTMPSGFPQCTNGHPEDCSFTNSKVIVARSYVRQIAKGTGAADSRPDDYTPRDHVGHGTAVASVAAANVNSGAVSFTGMAPKAYLGNYKVFGSPGVNDASPESILIMAINDALNDGMDVANLSAGVAALTGPLDTGTACGRADGVPCDPLAAAFEAAAQHAMIITVAVGNDGNAGSSAGPSYNVMSSPATAPSVIAVGATTNTHFFSPTVSVNAAASAIAGGNLQTLAAEPSDSAVQYGALAAPMVDVTQLGNDGYACSALPGGSLKGSLALIQRSPSDSSPGCAFSDKVNYATLAGAVGVVLYMADSAAPIQPGNLGSFDVPVVMLANADGVTLKSFIDAHPGTSVTIDMAGIEQNTITANEVVGFSSPGPFMGTTSLIKPDMLATGSTLYMATQSYDPAGELYSQNGYIGADGTSFAAPIVAGAAALVKQKYPGYSPAQIKSALVNTAAQDVTLDDFENPVDAASVGGGRLDAGAAIAATVSVSPSTIALGPFRAGVVPPNQQLQVTNSGSSAVTLSVSVTSAASMRNPTLARAFGPGPSPDKQSLTLAPRASGTINLNFFDPVLAKGFYSGTVTLQGPGVNLVVPFAYVSADGIPQNIVRFVDYHGSPEFLPPANSLFTDFEGIAGDDLGRVGFRVLDTYGAPLVNSPVSFTASGSVTLQNVSTTTDANGVASAEVILSANFPRPTVTGRVAGQQVLFYGYARPRPIIDHALDATNGLAAVAPGSYISLYGSGLSDPGLSGLARATPLPLALSGVTVSFDSGSISAPGHLVYAGPTQVNVQVPWELQGSSSAQVKVTIDEYSYGRVFTLPLRDYAPSFFLNSVNVADAIDLNGRVITTSNPAVRGQYIQLFANGLGPVTNQPASGDPVPADGSTLSQTTTLPVVSIGGQQAEVAFSGIAPGTTGEYQINVKVPQNIAPGIQPITISIGGQASPSKSAASGPLTIMLPVN